MLATVEISSRDGGLLRVGGAGSREPDKNPGVTSLVMASEQYNWLVRRIEKAEKEWRKEREEAKKAAEEEREGTNGDATNGDHATDEATNGDRVAGRQPPEDMPPERAERMRRMRETREEEKDFEVPDSLGVVLEIDVDAQFHDDDHNTYNTIADIPGTGEGLVMAGAHLDSWHTGTGATDNGAGCVVVMEAMRILKALDVQPKRTIRAALWSGEEQGLLGSRHHVEQNFAKLPLKEGQEDVPRWMREYEGEIETMPAHDTFSAYFNLDNGSGKIRGVYTQENLGVAPIFAKWLEPFHDLGADTITHRNTGGTDHLSFDAVGLPGFQFIQDGLDYNSRTHHTHADTLDHAVREDLMQASVIMASFLYHAAMRDEPLPRKPMPVFESDDD